MWDSKHERWYDWLWLLIPIAGVAFMALAISDRKIREDRN